MLLAPKNLLLSLMRFSHPIEANVVDVPNPPDVNSPSVRCVSGVESALDDQLHGSILFDSGVGSELGDQQLLHDSVGFEHMLAKEMVRRYPRESRAWLDSRYVGWTL